MPAVAAGTHAEPGTSLTRVFLRPHPHPSSICLQALQDYFDNTWTLTESLFASLQGEEAFMTLPAHGLRHPLIFYYGHPATLYVNKLRAAGIIHVREVLLLWCRV